MNAKWTAAAAALLVAAAGAYFTYFRDFAQRSGLLRPGEQAVVARGEAIYAQYCASCHGADLRGEPEWQTPKPNGRLPAPPHDETGHTWHHPDGLLVELTSRGTAAVVGRGYEGDMPGFAGTLSEEEIIAVLSFIKSRWPREIRSRHDELNRRAAK